MQGNTVEYQEGRPYQTVSRKHRVKRDLDQLLGLCQGVLADGAVSLSEAVTMQEWLQQNWDLRETWPANALSVRLESALADGKLDSDEERDLLGLLVELIGGKVEHPEARSAVTPLPFDSPAPPVIHDGRNFVLTGNFVFGPRKSVAAEIVGRGATVQSGVRLTTNYLVVGHLGSEDWLHASFGTKIADAMEIRERGGLIAVVAEQHWFDSLS